jgi:hypothetical protein
MLELIQRGQDSGDIDATLPPAWLLTVGLALGRAVGEAVRAGRMTIEEPTQAMHHSFLRLLGMADPPAPGPLSGHPAANAANPRAFLRQAARATVRSEKDSSERSVVRPVTYGGWFPGRGWASCSPPGWRSAGLSGAAVSRLMRSPGVRVSSGCGGRS